MSQRYFVESPILGSQAVLEGAEAHHLAHVMRAKPGQEVHLFDGTGHEFLARIESIGRSAVSLAVLSSQEIDRELTVPVIVGVSLPKGDRQRWLVEKLVELGAHAMVPLITSRAVAQPTGGALARLSRAVIEASKQCGRNRLMAIEAPQDWPSFIAHPPDDGLRVLAHPDRASPWSTVARDLEISKLQRVTIAVGPEGGLNDDEVRSAQSYGWMTVELGRRILRVETAAMFLTGLIAGALPESPFQR